MLLTPCAHRVLPRTGAVAAIDGLELVGRPDACVVAFTGTKESGINVYSLNDAMKDLRG